MHPVQVGELTSPEKLRMIQVCLLVLYDAVYSKRFQILNHKIFYNQYVQRGRAPHSGVFLPSIARARSRPSARRPPCVLAGSTPTMTRQAAR